MNQPPPPGEMGAFLNRLQLDLNQRMAETEERRHLRNEIERRKLELELASLTAPVPGPASTSPTQRRTISTYEQQIIAWFKRLPPEARKAPRTMEEFISLLQGRTSGTPAHPGEVSRVLNQIGWIRRRNWKSDGEGRRMWWPPI